MSEQTAKLPNGLLAELVSGPCGDASALAVVVVGGVDHDPPGRSGMAHVAEHVLALAPRQVETGSDYTLYSVVTRAEALPTELDAVAAWMKSAPTEAELERAKAAVLEELSRTDGTLNAMSLAEESLRPTPGLGRRLGIASEVRAITLAELQSFWQERFKPGNARMAVAGRFHAPKVRAHLEAAFAPLPSGTPPVARPPTGATVRGTLVMSERPTALAVALAAPPTDSPLYPAFLVLASRLTRPAPTPRSWQAHFDPVRRPELLFLTAPLAPGEPPEPAAERVRAEAGQLLAPPPTADDRARAKEQYRLFVEPDLLDPAVCAKDARALAIARARRAASKPLGGALVRGLEAVTAEQLEQTARLLGPDHSTAVLAGPR